MELDFGTARAAIVRHPAAADRSSPSDKPVHDLANLLGVIVGVTESLADSLIDQPEQAELARVGLLAAEKAAGLLASLHEARSQPSWDDDESDDLFADVQPTQTRLDADPAAPGSMGTVLVVDDDPRLLGLMSKAFSRAGYRTFAARNGRVAMQILAAAKPELMITDIVMPEMEGLATIREVRRVSPGTRILAISGGGELGRHDRFLSWAEGLGADEVMAKPFRLSSLLTAARLLVQRPGAVNA